jgi:hypothetical protein
MVRATRSFRFSLSLISILIVFPAVPAFGEIFVCAGDSIRVFADDAGPGSTPIRTITGPTSGVAECYAIALDNWHNELWVTTQTSIRAFGARATGDAAPLRTITGFGFASGIAVDVQADEVFVGTVAGVVSVYSRTDNGNPMPLRSIQGNLTTLDTVVGLFVDRVNNELYAENYGGSVVVFGRLADGNVAPLRPFANFPHPFGLVVDAHGNEVFVATGVGTINVYDRNGNALRTIGGSSTLLTHSAGLSLLQDGTILAGNQYGSGTTPDAVFGYPRTQNGDMAPTVQINFAAPLQRVLWGIASTRAFECGEGQTTSYCLFRSSFE